MASFFFLDFFERLPVGLIGHLFGHQRLQHLRFRLRLSAWLASAWARRLLSQIRRRRRREARVAARVAAPPRARVFLPRSSSLSQSPCRRAVLSRSRQWAAPTLHIVQQALLLCLQLLDMLLQSALVLAHLLLQGALLLCQAALLLT